MACPDAENKDECECTALVGVWTSLGVAAARHAGYKIIIIYEVRQFEETIKFDPEKGQDGIFNSYIVCCFQNQSRDLRVN